MKCAIKRSGILVLGGIIWFFITFFGILPLIEEIYQKHFGADSVYSLTGNLTGVPIVLSVIVFGIFIWLFSPNGAFGNLWRQEKGWKAEFSGKTKCIIAGISTLVAVIGIIGSLFGFERFTLDGVERYRFGQKKEYVWEDTAYFTLKSDLSGVLVFELVMKDGQKYDFNGGLLRAAEYSSDAYDKTVPEGVYDYAIWLSRELGKRNIPMQVADWEKLKKGLTYDSWDELADGIRTAYEEGKGKD